MRRKPKPIPRFANEAAELLLSHFASSDVGLGEAVRRMRHDLLAKGNLLGLAYTAYCSADLRIDWAETWASIAVSPSRP